MIGVRVCAKIHGPNIPLEKFSNANQSNLVIELNITHDRHGRSTSNPHTNGHLTHPDSLDRPLEIAARAKITKHQAAYSSNNSTSFMPGVASTSGRLHCEL